MTHSTHPRPVVSDYIVSTMYLIDWGIEGKNRCRVQGIEQGRAATGLVDCDETTCELGHSSRREQAGQSVEVCRKFAVVGLTVDATGKQHQKDEKHGKIVSGQNGERIHSRTLEVDESRY